MARPWLVRLDCWPFHGLCFISSSGDILSLYIFRASKMSDSRIFADMELMALPVVGDISNWTIPTSMQDFFHWSFFRWSGCKICNCPTLWEKFSKWTAHSGRDSRKQWIGGRVTWRELHRQNCWSGANKFRNMCNTPSWFKRAQTGDHLCLLT